MKGIISKVIESCKRKGKTLRVAQRYLRINRIKVSLDVLKKRDQATH